MLGDRLREAPLRVSRVGPGEPYADIAGDTAFEDIHPLADPRENDQDLADLRERVARLEQVEVE